MLLDTTLNIFRFILNGPPGPGSFDELQFQPGVGSSVPGTYTSSNTPGGQPFWVWSYQCSVSTTWQLTIYEAVAVPDGTAAKFSADFTMSCPIGGGAPPITGSVRVNSTVPPP